MEYINKVLSFSFLEHFPGESPLYSQASLDSTISPTNSTSTNSTTPTTAETDAAESELLPGILPPLDQPLAGVIDLTGEPFPIFGGDNDAILAAMIA